MDNFNLKNLIRSNIQKLEPYVSARDEFVSDGSPMIFLDANENPFESGVNRYPDPVQRRLKTQLASLKGVQVGKMLLGNGSDEILDLILRAFCEPKEDNIIILPPTYGMYKVLAEVNHLVAREVLLTSGFQPDAQRILEAVGPMTKIIFLCSPNNPTGNTFDPEIIHFLIKSFRGLVVIDEAYIDFAETESWTNYLDSYDNLVVIQTLSKAFGMAGIRLGICMASGEIIEVLAKIKPPYNVNELSQKCALERIGNEAAMRNEVSHILEERRRLENRLPEIGFVESIFPSNANFVLVKVDDASKRYAQLLEKGIVVRNRSSQPLCENTLRLTVGTKEENMKLIETLKSLQ